FSTNLESFPGAVFVTIGSLDRPELIEPKLEMFTKRRLAWAKPCDLPQFENMPS
ncbi:MAG TPA: aldehyde-activating protein, partial [Actinomycetes bacterium]|nr:aldehyde-activating protein [Actinomycetes bacterium]